MKFRMLGIRFAWSALHDTGGFMTKPPSAALAALAGRLGLVALCLAAAPVLAEPPAYRDDRTDAAALIGSLYNAIARQEYARAWDYFADPKPAEGYAAFAAGYAETASVEVKLGTAEPDGAAGSVYFPTPVALRAVDAAGKAQVFAGCYVVVQVNPAIQEPPFRPLQIQSGKLAPVETAFEATEPGACE